eukprot:TRINITY_DN12874_c0_g1_i1.p1 TRINITY_DN12874_c0_g1~~TRINITY_DN12874_c0_g1_i1.p1  ORF type:complete len:1367 (-),score=204.06 TRINITY_DN12874_c0_g1_i1:221-4321(-)
MATGTSPARTLCCLPALPCGSLVCVHADSATACQELSSSLSPIDINQTLCDEQTWREIKITPGWQDALNTCIYVPLATLVCLVALWPFLRRCYTRQINREPMNKLILDYVGTCDHPYPKHPLFMQLLDAGQLLLSLATTAIFLLNTYNQRLCLSARIAEVLFGLYFAFSYLMTAVRNEFRLSVIFELAQLVDLFTVPQMLLLCFPTRLLDVHWLSLNFLRSVRAFDAYQRLSRIVAKRLGVGEVTVGITHIAFKFVVLVMNYGSLVFCFEVLGDIPVQFGDPIEAEMGEITFFIVVYSIVETISTVGYGDYAPKLVGSRLVCICCMVSGVLFLSFELEPIMNLISRQKPGAGAYKRRPKRGTRASEHVILLGGGLENIDDTMLLAFMQELYSTRYKERWPDLVVMTSTVENTLKVQAFLEAHVDVQVQDYITYIVGSPLQLLDLQRCGCETASLIFIVADSTGRTNPVEEDKENILHTLSLKNSFTTSFRLMLLLEESIDKAVGVGILREVCLCVNEIKPRLLWQSCRCKGWGTLLANLTLTLKDASGVAARVARAPPWMQRYYAGLRNGLRGFLPSADLLGMSFARTASEIYKRTGICVIGVQVAGAIKLAPLTSNLVLEAEMVLLAIMRPEDDEILRSVSLSDEDCDWKVMFSRNWSSFVYSSEQVTVAIDENTSDTWSSSYKQPAMRWNDGIKGWDGLLPRAEVDESENDDGETYDVPFLRNSLMLEAGDVAISANNSEQESQQNESPEFPQTKRRSTWANVVTVVLGAKRRLTRLPGRSAVRWSEDEQSRVSAVRWSEHEQSGVAANEDEQSGVAANEDAQSQVACSSTLNVNRKQPPVTMERESPPKEDRSYMSPMSQILNTMNASSEALLTMEKHANDIIMRATSRPFILLCDLSSSWTQIMCFLRLSQEDYMPFKVPIVVLCPSAPPQAFVQEMADTYSNNLGIVQGDPHWAPDLRRGGALESSRVVCLGKGAAKLESTNVEEHLRSNSEEFGAMLDADVVLVYQMLERLGTYSKEIERIMDFQRPQNIFLLPPIRNEEDGSETVCATRRVSLTVAERLRNLLITMAANGPDALVRFTNRKKGFEPLSKQEPGLLLEEATASVGDLDEDGTLEREPSQGVSRSETQPSGDDAEEPGGGKRDASLSAADFAEDELFCLDARYAAGEVFTPYLFGSVLGQIFHTPGIMETMFCLARGGVDESGHQIRPWLLGMRSENVGRHYGELFLSFLEDPVAPALLVGILREHESSAGKGYVYTNPERTTECMLTDQLYVLADKRFGRATYYENLLPLGGRDPQEQLSRGRRTALRQTKVDKGDWTRATTEPSPVKDPSPVQDPSPVLYPDVPQRRNQRRKLSWVSTA